MLVVKSHNYHNHVAQISKRFILASIKMFMSARTNSRHRHIQTNMKQCSQQSTLIKTFQTISQASKQAANQSKCAADKQTDICAHTQAQIIFNALLKAFRERTHRVN